VQIKAMPASKAGQEAENAADGEASMDVVRMAGTVVIVSI
jgi:hypothetical protein